ncbi:hypothetical protein P0F28_003025 [Vibrio metschnikovii]|nr:hypothetical protein [Vibrio metschnikovii]
MNSSARWERALSIFDFLVQKSSISYNEIGKPNEDDYYLYDQTCEKLPNINDKNFFFVHKTVNFDANNFVFSGTGNVVVISEGVITKNLKVVLAGKNGLLYIDKNVRLGACSLRLGSRYNLVHIGDSTTWESGSASVMEDNMYLHIGQGCMLSTNVEFITSDKHPIFDRISGQRINMPGSIDVGNNVWMARSVRVSKGVNIAEGCIIGQGTLVTKSTESFSAYAGIPSKKIKGNVEWRRSLKIKNIEPCT